MKPCPCKSQKLYRNCCAPYHLGTLPKDALALMRSRYSAYALGLVDYILITTHPDYPQQLNRKEIEAFCHETNFAGLTILQYIHGEKVAYVTFFAELRQGEKDISFTEKSRFEKLEGKWYYRSACTIAS